MSDRIRPAGSGAAVRRSPRFSQCVRALIAALVVLAGATFVGALTAAPAQARACSRCPIDPGGGSGPVDTPYHAEYLIQARSLDGSTILPDTDVIASSVSAIPKGTVKFCL